MDFENDIVFWMTLFGKKIPISETIFNTWIIMAFLIVIAIIVRIKLNNFKDVPTGSQNVIETIVESMDNFVISTMEEKYSYFGRWFFTVIVFIFCSNLSGLVGLRPPTADLGTTAMFGLSTFFLIHLMGILTAKADYFKGYFDPHPLFFPLNIMGELATPISLSFRLFGNILGGLIIMGMVYGLFPTLLKIGIPAALHIYFDAFSGSLQAFIFTILSMTFIKDKIAD